MKEGWYYAQGDPQETRRFWDGQRWVGEPRPLTEIDEAAAKHQEPIVMQPAGWYHAKGDPVGTQRYWDGSTWQGQPQPVPGFEPEPTAAPTSNDFKRVGARLLDGSIWFILAVIVQMIFGGQALSNGRLGFFSAFIVSILGLAIGIGYETLMLSQMGATAGKLAFNLKIAAADGSKPDPLTALRRSAVLYGAVYVAYFFWFVGPAPVIGIVFLLAIIGAGLYFYLNDRSYQMPWDKVGETSVMEA